MGKAYIAMANEGIRLLNEVRDDLREIKALMYEISVDYAIDSEIPNVMYSERRKNAQEVAIQEGDLSYSSSGEDENLDC